MTDAKTCLHERRYWTEAGFIMCEYCETILGFMGRWTWTDNGIDFMLKQTGSEA